MTSSIVNKYGKHIFCISKLRQKRRYSNRLSNKQVIKYRNRINTSTLEKRRKGQDVRKCSQLDLKPLLALWATKLNIFIIITYNTNKCQIKIYKKQSATIQVKNDDLKRLGQMKWQKMWKINVKAQKLKVSEFQWVQIYSYIS